MDAQHPERTPRCLKWNIAKLAEKLALVPLDNLQPDMIKEGELEPLSNVEHQLLQCLAENEGVKDEEENSDSDDEDEVKTEPGDTFLHLRDEKAKDERIFHIMEENRRLTRELEELEEKNQNLEFDRESEFSTLEVYTIVEENKRLLRELQEQDEEIKEKNNKIEMLCEEIRMIENQKPDVDFQQEEELTTFQEEVSHQFTRMNDEIERVKGQ